MEWLNIKRPGKKAKAEEDAATIEEAGKDEVTEKELVV